MELLIIGVALLWIAWEMHRAVDFVKNVAVGYLEAEQRQSRTQEPTASAI